MYAVINQCCPNCCPASCSPTKGIDSAEIEIVPLEQVLWDFLTTYKGTVSPA
jgi:hypothetical protein